METSSLRAGAAPRVITALVGTPWPSAGYERWPQLAMTSSPEPRTPMPGL